MIEENNIISNLPKELKIQLDILASENHTSVSNLILNILNAYVQNEFSDLDNKTE